MQGAGLFAKMLNPSIGPFLHLNKGLLKEGARQKKEKKKEGMNTMTHIDLVVRIYCIPFFSNLTDNEKYLTEEVLSCE